MSTNSYAPRSGTRLVNLSLANLLLAIAVMMPLLGVSAARADDTFTVRTITTPDGDIVEDQIATEAGSYAATGPVNGDWLMQVATFR